MLYQLLEKSGLHPTELQLIELVASNQMQDGWCAMPKSVMAKELKRSSSRIFYLLRSLVLIGFLLKSTTKSKNHHSLYKVTDKWRTLN